MALGWNRSIVAVAVAALACTVLLVGICMAAVHIIRRRSLNKNMKIEMERMPQSSRQASSGVSDVSSQMHMFKLEIDVLESVNMNNKHPPPKKVQDSGIYSICSESGTTSTSGSAGTIQLTQGGYDETAWLVLKTNHDAMTMRDLITSGRVMYLVIAQNTLRVWPDPSSGATERSDGYVLPQGRMAILTAPSSGARPDDGRCARMPVLMPWSGTEERTRNLNLSRLDINVALVEAWASVGPE